jgi:hypothetical protein
MAFFGGFFCDFLNIEMILAPQLLHRDISAISAISDGGPLRITAELMEILQYTPSKKKLFEYIEKLQNSPTRLLFFLLFRCPALHYLDGGEDSLL